MERKDNTGALLLSKTLSFYSAYQLLQDWHHCTHGEMEKNLHHPRTAGVQLKLHGLLTLSKADINKTQKKQTKKTKPVNYFEHLLKVIIKALL